MGWVPVKAGYGIQASLCRSGTRVVAQVVVCYRHQARRGPQTAPTPWKKPTPSLTQGSGPCHSSCSSFCRVSTVVPSCQTWVLTIKEAHHNCPALHTSLHGHVQPCMSTHSPAWAHRATHECAQLCVCTQSLCRYKFLHRNAQPPMGMYNPRWAGTSLGQHTKPFIGTHNSA